MDIKEKIIGIACRNNFYVCIVTNNGEVYDWDAKYMDSRDMRRSDDIEPRKVIELSDKRVGNLFLFKLIIKES